MDLRRLDYFLAVVEHGGITSAASALRLAQPSLSQAIRSLERELDAELFHRGGRGLTLTPAGEALLEPARRVLANVDTARSAVHGVIDLASGWLDIAAHGLLTVDPLAAVLASFHRRHPGVPVRLHQPRDDDDMVRRVLDGRCELAVTHLPVQRAGLKLTLLGTQQIGVLLPPGTPPGPDPLPITALDGLPIIDSMRGYDTVRAVVRDALRRAGVRMRRSVVTFHPESIVPLVIAGGGAAFVNDRYAREGAMAGVTVRRLHPAITCDVGLLHREGTLSPASRGFTDVLLEETAVLREFA